jgi:hypothetical protein
MNRVVWSALSTLALLAAGTAPGFAELITVDIGLNVQQTQTDAAGDLGSTNAYFAGRAFYQNTGDYDSGTLTYPGSGSPASMNNTPGTYTFLNGGTAAGYFIDQSGSYGSLAGLEADYPMGSYAFDLNDSTGTNPDGTSTISYGSDLFPDNAPVLTATSFNALQNMNATQAQNVSFGAMVNNPGFAGDDESYVFLDIYTAGFGTDVYSTNSSTADLTNFALPANSLDPGTSYSLVLDFDNRIAGADGNLVNQFQLFDTKTEVDFTTATPVVTPEPAGFILALFGVVALFGMQRGRARA